MDEVTSPFKRRAKIYAKKLPRDFFTNKKIITSDERSPTISNRNEIHTHDYCRMSAG
jgi:hypothetical protein